MHRHSHKFPPEFLSFLEWLKESDIQAVSIENSRHRVTRAAQALMGCTTESSYQAWQGLLEICVELENDHVPTELLHRFHSRWSCDARVLSRLASSLGSLRRLAYSYRQLMLPSPVAMSA